MGFPIAGSGIDAGDRRVIWQPFGANDTELNIFTSWTAAHAAVSAIDGDAPRELMIDVAGVVADEWWRDAFRANWPYIDEGAWDMSGIVLSGASHRPLIGGGSRHYLRIGTGTTMPGLRVLRNVGVLMQKPQGEAALVSDIASYDSVRLYDSEVSPQISEGGGGWESDSPAFEAAAGATLFAIEMFGHSGIGTYYTNRPLVSVPADCHAYFDMHGDSTVSRNALIGGSAASMCYFYGPAASNVSSYFPSWLGGFEHDAARGPRFTTGYATITAPVDLADYHGRHFTIDATAGTFTQPLPAIYRNATYGYFSGGRVTVLSETSGVNGVTISCYGTETINGASTFWLDAGATATFISDGVSNWTVTSEAKAVDASVSTPTVLNDGSLLEIYVDGVNGDDTNNGLSESTALETIPAALRRFPTETRESSRIKIHLAGVGGFGDSATAVQAYECYSLIISGRGNHYSNTFSYIGPEMVAITPATGPATAAADATPAVAVAGGSAKAGGTLSVRFDFTTAAPGWTVDDFQGYFLRVTRAGVKVTWELPIAHNTADTITTRVTGIAPLFLDTDTYEIVEPAVRIAAPTDYPPQVLGTGGAMSTVWYEGTGANFQRICFYSGIVVEDANGASFDRCMLDPQGYGAYLSSPGMQLVLCTCIYFQLSGGSIGGMWYYNSEPSDASDPMPANLEYCMDLQIYGSGGGLTVSSTSTPGKFFVSYGLGVDIDSHSGITVYDNGVLDVGYYSRWEQIAIQGECGGSGSVFRVSRGGRVTIVSNVARPGATSVYCTGGGVPLRIRDGAETYADYGTGVGEFEEVAGYRGYLYRIPALGTAYDGTTIIKLASGY